METRLDPARAGATRTSLLNRFLHDEAGGGLVLIVATLVAIGWANSPWRDAYHSLWSAEIDLGLFTGDLKHVVNDGGMTLFFFVVGLEIKREFLRGELAGRERAALPVAAALGGMVVPAAIYLAINAGGASARGWGIPMATDIAFAVGVMALAGPRVSTSLKVFLLGLAIVDDIGAIVVIAVFYGSGLAMAPSLLALAVLGGIVALRAAGVRRIAWYVVPALVFWLAVYHSGVHATIAGVVLAMLTPDRADKGGSTAPLEYLEGLLHPWVTFLVVPLFALANAGLEITPRVLTAPFDTSVGLGAFLGLLLGKPAGIFLASWLATRLGAAQRPQGVRWLQLLCVGVLGGIGFTMSLFISGTAFESSAAVADATAGIFLATMLSALGGLLLLRRL